MNARPRTASTLRIAAVVALVGFVSATPRPAGAAIVMDTNAGGACKAAYSGST